MIFNSKNVAFLISIMAAFFTLTSCIILFDVTEPLLYLLVSLASFFGCYAASYILLEYIVFKELKNVYHKIIDLEGDSREFVLDSMGDFTLNRMSSELFSYSEQKTKELKKMKEIENFRRQFLADIAHELKTPVHTAQGFVETLIDGAVEDMSVRDRFLKKLSLIHI